MIYIHLFTTDISGLDLPSLVSDNIKISAIIVPGNRKLSKKVAELKSRSDVPIFMHEMSSLLPENLPKADAGLSWLYSQIINPIDLKRYPLGILNMHGGKIPEYRGANVLQWQIINGERQLGITWHELIKEVDAGPIWSERMIDIPGNANALEMRLRMISEAKDLFPNAWKGFINKGEDYRIPDLKYGRIWPSRKPRDGRIGRFWTELKVRNMIRALCDPWPPATIQVDKDWVPVREVSNLSIKKGIPYATADNTIIYLLNDVNK